ncbi:hypothetical protein [Pseudophaeobacter sp.]|uniref:hypothetical protein n=1 Tax=Pseudophaeobacter sp. TaxID=1971739 RepID=UPI0032D9754A
MGALRSDVLRVGCDVESFSQTIREHADVFDNRFVWGNRGEKPRLNPVWVIDILKEQKVFQPVQTPQCLLRRHRLRLQCFHDVGNESYRFVSTQQFCRNAERLAMVEC